jgi:Raf kinase inhibitor-like YbhB/YbcL family protein
MRLESSEFIDGGTMPSRFAADDANLSPPLYWRAVPSHVRSFALVCEDVDAQPGEIYHWAIYNIPHDMYGLPENASLTYANSDDIFQGTNDAGFVGYLGPKSFDEQHHYYFRLLALDTRTRLPPGMPDKEVLYDIEGHIIEEADITGVYGVARVS